MISTRISPARLAIVMAFAAFVSVLFGCTGGDEKPSAGKSEPVAGQTQLKPVMDLKLPKAPNFELPRLEGGTLRLSDYRGSIIILDFWATWCAPCRMSIPHLVRLYNDLKSEKVVVIGVSVDQGGPEIVEKFVDEFKIPYPIVFGSPQLVTAYGNFQSIPVSFLINANGELVEQYVGFRPRQVYEDAIRALQEESKSGS